MAVGHDQSVGQVSQLRFPRNHNIYVHGDIQHRVGAATAVANTSGPSPLALLCYVHALHER